MPSGPQPSRRKGKPQAPIACALLLTAAATATPADAQNQHPWTVNNPTQSTGPIRLDTVGYLADHAKQATIAAPCSDFTVVVDGTADVVCSGHVSAPKHDSATAEDVYIADFSKVRAPGVYRLIVTGVGASAPFRIGDDVYREPLRAAMQAMYLWRCGAAVKVTYRGVTYGHDACHLDDAYLDYVGGGHVKKPSVAGWHDAGDYNKYTVNGAFSVGLMFLAWEQNQTRLAKLDLPYPNTAPGYPAYLAETKWEMDWLLTMQADDGSVYHKVSTIRFGGDGSPADEATPRYFVPWGSPATADFAAVTAMAARIYRPFDPAYAERCRLAALKSYAFLVAHPQYHAPDQSAFHTGGYGTGDADDRLWAAAEVWESTGDPAALADFEARARAFPAADRVAVDWGWQDVQNIGIVTYLRSLRAGRDPELVRELSGQVIEAADALVAIAKTQGYGRPVIRYYWGDNGGVALAPVVLQEAETLRPSPEYAETGLDAIHYLFGRNYFGRSFVTGVGFDPPGHPHFRPTGTAPDSPAPDVPVWPGYLVGGGWPGPRDWVDEASVFQVNEVAINWNAALIYALSANLP